jgi:LacI family transcriptional regulator
MGRQTISDLAEAAGVSVATVNRVLGGKENVRQQTMQRVLSAAEDIGFYGIKSLAGRVSAAREQHRLGILLLQSNRSFYQRLAKSLEDAALAIDHSDVRLKISYINNLSPDHVAQRLLELGGESDCIAVVSAQHPLVADAIETLARNGVPVFGLISPLTAGCNVGYVGLDNWKVGRTAAWAFDHFGPKEGKIGILVGNHRYRCQELNESGFRSYFREHGQRQALLEPLSTFESSAIAREMTERLLAENPDMTGLFLSGGGITGALAALRASERKDELIVVGYELMDATRSALLDGILTLVISHPLKALAQTTIESMIQARKLSAEAGIPSIQIPFEIFTSENI